MRMPVRRALIAATVTALALPSGASASCLPHCHDDAVYAAVTTVQCLPICLDEMYRLMDKLLAEREGDAAGTLCAYAKLSGDPPPGWTGSRTAGPPYIWVQTKEWGKQNEGHFDHDLCIPACVVEQEMLALPDLSGVTLVRLDETTACAAP